MISNPTSVFLVSDNQSNIQSNASTVLQMDLGDTILNSHVLRFHGSFMGG